MTAPALAVAGANLLLIAALPRVFFRPGRLNAAWWATASPFGIAGAGVCAVAAGLIPAAALSSFATLTLATTTIVLASASVGLICHTAATHARPVSLWHQERDTPAALVTRGPYAHVRHPFYAAFLLALAACVAAAPSPLTAVALACGTIQLTRTARREERRLLAAFGSQYAEYMRQTGRFTPKL
jgi:protein-S-isoprenylcysteine O-methyltransferase Ste14